MRKYSIWGLVLILALLVSGCAAEPAETTLPDAATTVSGDAETTVATTAAQETAVETTVEATEAPTTATTEPAETTAATESSAEETQPAETAPETTAPTEAETEPPHEHSYKKSKTVDPTCTKKGYTVYKCKCGDSYKDDYTKAVGHSWGDWTTTKEPTTAEEGEKVRACTVCKETQTEKLEKLPGETPPATEAPTTPPVTEAPTTTPSETAPATQPDGEHQHSYTEEVVAPTCDWKGYTLHKCACGDSYKDNETDAIGHKWQDWVVTKEPTKDTNGEKTRTCANCQRTDTFIIDKLVQEEEAPPETEATQPKPSAPAGVRVSKVGNITLYTTGDCAFYDYRTWGNPPKVSLHGTSGLHVIYDNKDGNNVEVYIEPIEGKNVFYKIKNDGTVQQGSQNKLS